MSKRKGHFIYFNESDARVLNRLAQKRNESKSAVVRKLIHIAQYKNVLNEIEANNKIISGYLKEFTHIGTNINQIAYHLNANIIRHEEAKTDLEKSMVELIKKMQELNKKIETLKIEISVEHTKTKTPSQVEEKREENE